MPSHYNEEEKKKRSRLPGLEPGKELTTAGPGIEAIKSAVSETGKTLFGGIAPEKRGGYRGHEIGERAGTGFMESGIPIPTSQAGVMQPMPTRPAMGDTADPMLALPDGVGGTGTGEAIPSGAVDLTPRLTDISTGVASGLPPAFDVDAAHKLGMKRFGEGQVHLPPGQRSRYSDIMDKVLGPAPTTGPAPVTEGIPSEIAAPGSSGNAMVDLFRWVSHNKRVQQQNKQLAEQKKRGLEAERYEDEQEFKERKLVSEEKGRTGALDLSRRKAIATEAKGAEKLDPFVKRAVDLLEKSDEYKYEQDPEKRRTMRLKEIEEVEKRHGRSRSGEKKVARKKIGEKEYEKVNGQWMEV